MREPRLIFGHQSVGWDIIDGLIILAPHIAVHQLTQKTSQYEGPGIWHKEIGTNGNPVDKIAKFKALLLDNAHDFEIGLLKLCYADINSNTDIAAVFAQYNEFVRAILARHPHFRFIHATVPLRAIKAGIRFKIYSFLGRRSPPCEDNLRREELNDLLRAQYRKPNSIFFDLAALQTTNGSNESKVKYRHKHVRSLCLEYTDDGGHLNDKGRKHVATHFLNLLRAQGFQQETLPRAANDL